MILTETIFCDGAPVGVVRQDTLTQQIAFTPIKDWSRLPDREWVSVDDLKAAVLKAYSHSEEGAPR